MYPPVTHSKENLPSKDEGPTKSGAYVSAGTTSTFDKNKIEPNLGAQGTADCTSNYAGTYTAEDFDWMVQKDSQSIQLMHHPRIMLD